MIVMINWIDEKQQKLCKQAAQKLLQHRNQWINKYIDEHPLDTNRHIQFSKHDVFKCLQHGLKKLGVRCKSARKWRNDAVIGWKKYRSIHWNYLMKNDHNKLIIDCLRNVIDLAVLYIKRLEELLKESTSTTTETSTDDTKNDQESMLSLNAYGRMIKQEFKQNVTSNHHDINITFSDCETISNSSVDIDSNNNSYNNDDDHKTQVQKVNKHKRCRKDVDFEDDDNHNLKMRKVESNKRFHANSNQNKIDTNHSTIGEAAMNEFLFKLNKLNKDKSIRHKQEKKGLSLLSFKEYWLNLILDEIDPKTLEIRGRNTRKERSFI